MSRTVAVGQLLRVIYHVDQVEIKKSETSLLLVRTSGFMSMLCFLGSHFGFSIWISQGTSLWNIRDRSSNPRHSCIAHIYISVNFKDFFKKILIYCFSNAAISLTFSPSRSVQYSTKSTRELIILYILYCKVAMDLLVGLIGPSSSAHHPLCSVPRHHHWALSFWIVYDPLDFTDC